MFKFKSISTRVAVSFALVLPIVAWALWSQVQQSWSAYRAADAADAENAAGNMLIAGVSNILIERALINSALQQSQPAGANNVEAILARRTAANSKIGPAIKILETKEFPRKKELLTVFNAALEKADLYRKKSDDALKQDKAARDPDTVANAYKVLSDFVGKAEALWSGLLGNAKESELSRLAQIKFLAWTMRDTAGKERSGIGRAIAAKESLSASELTKISVIRGKVDVLWDLILNNVKLENEHPGIVAGVNGVKDDYLGKMRLRADEMIKASKDGAKYPVSVGDWTKETTPFLTKILDLLDQTSNASERHTAEMKQEGWNYAILNAFLLVACVLLFIGAIAFSVFTVARPLQALALPLGKFAEGDFTAGVPYVERPDEIGQIAGAVKTMAERVRSALLEIKVVSREVTSASAEISTATTDLSQRTEEQAASLEETSASMEEIASTVKNNADSADRANKSAEQTRIIARRSSEVVAKAVAAMARIEESSTNISEIIVVIDEIARQTNLLALNAAVEAARAGEAGRGFAVVASEVRSLAQRSSQAAKDITNLITTSGSQVQEGVQLVNQTGSALDEITKSIKAVTEIVRGIANASSEQATGIDEVNKAMTLMDSATQQNSALVEENAATAKMLELQAKNMDAQVSFFRLEAESGH